MSDLDLLTMRPPLEIVLVVEWNLDELSDYIGLPSGTAEPWNHDMSSTTLVGAWSYTAEVDLMLKP